MATRATTEVRYTLFLKFLAYGVLRPLHPKHCLAKNKTSKSDEKCLGLGLK